MIYSKADVELLKVVALCRDIPMTSDAVFDTSLLDRSRISHLLAADALKLRRNGATLRPTQLTYLLTRQAGYCFHHDLAANNKKTIAARRLNTFRLVMTFLRAGMDVFIPCRPGEPIPMKPDSLLTSAEIRRASRNALGSATLYGVVFMGRTAYCIWCGGQGIYTQNEIRIFNRLVEDMRIRTGQEYDRALVFMGSTLEDITWTVFATDDSKRSGKSREGQSLLPLSAAYDELSFPIHFIPLSDQGAHQLKIMRLPDYRQAIARAIMGSSFRSPYADMPDTDTVLDSEPHEPVVIAMDMDIKRIDRALKQAREGGFDRIALYALPWQESFLTERYEKMELAFVYAFEVSKLNRLLGGALTLYEPSEEAFIFDKEG